MNRPTLLTSKSVRSNNRHADRPILPCCFFTPLPSSQRTKSSHWHHLPPSAYLGLYPYTTSQCSHPSIWAAQAESTRTKIACDPGVCHPSLFPRSLNIVVLEQGLKRITLAIDPHSRCYHKIASILFPLLMLSFRIVATERHCTFELFRVPTSSKSRRSPQEASFRPIIQTGYSNSSRCAIVELVARVSQNVNRLQPLNMPSTFTSSHRYRLFPDTHVMPSRSMLSYHYLSRRSSSSHGTMICHARATAPRHDRLHFYYVAGINQSGSPDSSRSVLEAFRDPLISA